MNAQTHTTLETFAGLTSALASLPSLAPCNRTNEHFERLIEFVCACPRDIAELVSATPAFEGLAARTRALASIGESLLEQHWTRRVLQSGTSAWEELGRFPYLDHYVELVRLEARALQEYPSVRSVLFVGSGPLPLSAILLAHEHGYNVTALDCNRSAVAVSRKLVARLKMSERIRVVCAHVGSYSPGEDAIVLGALVGRDSEEKSKILEHLAAVSVPGTPVLARSAEQLRTALYPVVPSISSLHHHMTLRGGERLINTVEVLTTA